MNFRLFLPVIRFLLFLSALRDTLFLESPAISSLILIAAIQASQAVPKSPICFSQNQGTLALEDSALCREYLASVGAPVGYSPDHRSLIHHDIMLMISFLSLYPGRHQPTRVPFLREPSQEYVMAARTVRRTARKAARKPARKSARASRSARTASRARTSRRTATRRTSVRRSTTRRASVRRAPARASEVRVAREVLVVKKDGRRENFDREKLRRSIERAAERTSIDNDRAREIAQRIAERVERDARGAMSTTEIRERLLRELDREERAIADEFRSYRRFGF